MAVRAGRAPRRSGTWWMLGVGSLVTLRLVFGHCELRYSVQEGGGDGGVSKMTLCMLVG